MRAIVKGSKVNISMEDVVLNWTVKSSQVVQAVAQECCGNMDDVWVKARREFYHDVLLPKQVTEEQRKMAFYLYVKLAGNEIIAIENVGDLLIEAHAAELSGGVKTRMFHGEPCFLITEPDLRRWNIRFWKWQIPNLYSQVMHGERATVQKEHPILGAPFLFGDEDYGEDELPFPDDCPC